MVSGLSIFIACLGGNFEFDLNKVIAFSTLRQLGLMIMTISIGLSILAFFLLLTHALFKITLFPSAVSVSDPIGDSQDIRFIGGLTLYIPFTSSSLMVSNLYIYIYI